MKVRRFAIGIAAALVAAGAFSATAFAGGVGRDEEVSGPGNVPFCAVGNCAQAGSHTHDGATYAPHHPEDGHVYHAAEALAAVLTPAKTTRATLAASEIGVCPVPGCTEAGNHAHDGAPYAAHHEGDGHGYHGGGQGPSAGQGTGQGAGQGGHHGDRHR